MGKIGLVIWVIVGLVFGCASINYFAVWLISGIIYAILVSKK